MKEDYDDDALELIKEHRGEHCHEPTIARVLQKAASKNKINIVKQLLNDGVHPDVCVKQGDKTAFEVAGSSASVGSSARSIIRKLLYKQGAKVHPPPSWYPWTHWHGIDSETQPPATQLTQSDIEGPDRNGMEGEEFRALIVDIYTPVSSNPSTEPGDPRQGMTEKTSVKTSKPEQEGRLEVQYNLAGHEYHRIVHPTVDELIYGKGPGAIMGPTPSEFRSNQFKHYRWIHLPMNHVSSTVKNQSKRG